MCHATAHLRAKHGVLRQVTSPKDQQQYWAREEAWSFVPGDMFVEAFSRHQSGQAMAAQLSQPLDQSRHKPDSLITTRYALSGKPSQYLCLAAQPYLAPFGCDSCCRSACAWPCLRHSAACLSAHRLSQHAQRVLDASPYNQQSAGLPALRAMIDRELVLMRRTFFVYIVKAVQARRTLVNGLAACCPNFIATLAGQGVDSLAIARACPPADCCCCAWRMTWICLCNFFTSASPDHPLGALQSGIVAFVVATLFLRTHIHSHTIQDANLVAGMLFFTLIQSLFSGIAEMTFAVGTAQLCSHFALLRYELALQGIRVWLHTSEPVCCLSKSLNKI